MFKKNPLDITPTRRRVFTKKRVAMITAAALGITGLAVAASKADEPGVEELEETLSDKSA